MFTALSKIGGVVEDITRYTKKYGADTTELVFTTGDAIYLGSEIKFNHAFLKFNTAALSNVPFEVSLYDGQDFQAVGRLTDQTNELTESNYIEFAPKYGTSWSCQNTMDIAEIADVQYLNMYWVKLELLESDSVILEYIGHKFNTDLDVFAEHPELNNQVFFNQFNGTDFEAQAVIAGELIEGELLKRGYAKGLESVLEWDNLTRASVSKVCEIIYTTFGNTYADDIASLRKEYINRMNIAFPLLDLNNTAEKAYNKKMTLGRLYR